MRLRFTAPIVALMAATPVAAQTLRPAKEISGVRLDQPDDQLIHTPLTVVFSAANHNVPDAAKVQIRETLRAALLKGSIVNVKFAVWSDKAFPAKSTKDLPKADRELAEARGDAMRRFLKNDLQLSGIHVFNMARGTNWLAKAFNTEDAEIKKIFAGEETTLSGSRRLELQAFRDSGRPSTAVLVFESNPKALAH